VQPSFFFEIQSNGEFKVAIFYSLVDFDFRRFPRLAVPLEKLDRPLMLFRGGSGFERAQVPTPPSLGISLPGIQTELIRY
jgi:hypothetical protein